MKRIRHRKPKIQDTKYKYITGETDFASIQKTGSSQNAYPFNMFSYKKKHNSLCFPNTIFIQSKLLNVNNRNLRQSKIKHMHKISSKSIELSRKYNLLQRKDDVKHEDKFAIMPKAAMPTSYIISKSQIISKLSQSLNNITNNFSTISTSSLSNFKIRNKEVFASTGNKYKSISSVTSIHLHPSSCELEVNILNYETDILLRNKISHSTLPHLNPPDTKFLSNEAGHLAKIQDDKDEFDNQNTIDKYYKWNANKDTRDVKYLWKTVDNLLPSYQIKRFDSLHEIEKFGIYNKKPYDCKIKYSWQVIGISTQTSYKLLQDLLHDDANIKANKSAYKMCNIKYSWQIIGISTQASLHSYNDLDYWNGILLTPNKDYNKYNSYINNNGTDYVKVQDHTKYSTGRLKQYLILNNQQTQTFSEKEIQTDINHCYKKYSWQNLIKQYL